MAAVSTPQAPVAAPAAAATVAAPPAVAPPVASYQNASLYVGDLSPDVTEQNLWEIFQTVGPVASVRVCRDMVTRRSLGYAYVNFHDPQNAERALDTLNYSLIRNRPCRIMWSQRDPSSRKSGASNVFVKSIDLAIDNKQLHDRFTLFGNVVSAKVQVDLRTGRSLGYGYVMFDSEEAAQKAIQNPPEINNTRVVVEAFKPRGERNAAERGKFTNVYVRNWPKAWSPEQLREKFALHGEITSQYFSPKGWACFNYKTPEEAVNAIAKLHDQDFEGQKLFVVRAMKRSEREKEQRERYEKSKSERQKQMTNVYVKNLTEDVDDAKLKDMFKSFGNITSAKVMIDEKKRSRLFGFVCFQTPEEATKAITEMNGKLLENKPLYVALHQRKEQRRAALEQAARARNAMMMPGMPQFMYPMNGMAPMMMPPQWMNMNMMPPRVPFPGAPMPAPMMRGGRGGWPPMVQQFPGRGGMGAPYGMPRGRGRGGRGGRGGRPPQQPAREQAPAAPAVAPAPAAPAQPESLTAQLAEAPAEQQKQMLGERLYPLIQDRLTAQNQPELAGKITGMLLELDNTELVHLIEAPDALLEKINDALAVLREHQQSAGDTTSA